jgi:hypothetical protein
MSDLYLEHDTTEEDLAAQLPSFMPKDPESGNYRFLATIAERLEATRADVEAVDRAKSVQHADTTEEIERLARLVDLKPHRNESREHYRARVLAEFQLVTSEGTVADVLNATATILGASVSNIDYTEEHTTEAGTAQLKIPSSLLDGLELTESDFAAILDKLIPAGYRIDALRKGTFTYISEATYNSGGHDSTKGYDGLDTNGDPKGNGGTYSGTIE